MDVTVHAGAWEHNNLLVYFEGNLADDTIRAVITFPFFAIRTNSGKVQMFEDLRELSDKVDGLLGLIAIGRVYPVQGQRRRNTNDTDQV